MPSQPLLERARLTGAEGSLRGTVVLLAGIELATY
jgi:hypothetical protein